MGSPGPTRVPRTSASASAAALRYGSGQGSGRGSGSGSDSARRSTHEVKGELRSIYRQHVPEKSVAEVEIILQKFAGKEEDLLAKVRRKYIG